MGSWDNKQDEAMHERWRSVQSDAGAAIIPNTRNSCPPRPTMVAHIDGPLVHLRCQNSDVRRGTGCNCFTSIALCRCTAVLYLVASHVTHVQ